MRWRALLWWSPSSSSSHSHSHSSIRIRCWRRLGHTITNWSSTSTRSQDERALVNGEWQLSKPWLNIVVKSSSKPNRAFISANEVTRVYNRRRQKMNEQLRLPTTARQSSVKGMWHVLETKGASQRMKNKNTRKQLKWTNKWTNGKNRKIDVTRMGKDQKIAAPHPQIKYDDDEKLFSSSSTAQAPYTLP